MTVYRPDDPDRIRAAADHADSAAATVAAAADGVVAADPGDRLQGPFAEVVRARLRDRRSEAAATAPELRSLADRLREQAVVVAARIVAIEAAAAEAVAICVRWPELAGRIRGLAGLDTGWLDAVGPLRSDARSLAARAGASP